MSFDRDEARETDFSIPCLLKSWEEGKPDDQPVEAMLRVYSPVYDPKATRWRFWYDGKHHYMNVSESNIGEIVARYGGVLVDDRFRVMLRVEEENGRKITFNVLDVLEFYPAYRQPGMFDS